MPAATFHTDFHGFMEYRMPAQRSSDGASPVWSPQYHGGLRQRHPPSTARQMGCAPAARISTHRSKEKTRSCRHGGHLPGTPKRETALFFIQSVSLYSKCFSSLPDQNASFSSRYFSRSSILIRSCSMVSLSRTVTAPSFSESKS